ncbi:hypothetical protein CRUP_026344, partial [Coryphaenoides rupestris]
AEERAQREAEEQAQPGETLEPPAEAEPPDPSTTTTTTTTQQATDSQGAQVDESGSPPPEGDAGAENSEQGPQPDTTPPLQNGEVSEGAESPQGEDKQSKSLHEQEMD